LAAQLIVLTKRAVDIWLSSSTDERPYVIKKYSVSGAKVVVGRMYEQRSKLREIQSCQQCCSNKRWMM